MGIRGGGGGGGGKFNDLDGDVPMARIWRPIRLGTKTAMETGRGTDFSERMWHGKLVAEPGRGTDLSEGEMAERGR